MKVRSQTRSVPALQMRAEVAPSSLNEEARTVDVIWTTGARIFRRSFWDGDFYEELSLDPKHVRMDRLTSGRAPLLHGHNGYDPNAHVGVIDSANLQKTKGVATVRFVKDDVEADKVWNKVRQGVLTSVSVGYRIHKMEKVEGGEGKPPVFRAVDWEPYEVSFVPMPADEGSHARADSDTNSCEFITRGEAPHEEMLMPEDETKNKAPAETDAARKAELEKASKEAADQEHTRAAEIRKSVRALALGDEFADRLVNDRTPLAKARELVLEEAAKRSDAVRTDNHVRVEAGETEREKRFRGMTGWLLERSGKAGLIEQAQASKKYGRHFKNVETDGGEFRGLTLVELARECLERSGVNTRGMDKMTLVGRAFTHRSGGMQSTSDFSTLFETAIHKMLLAAYATAPDNWRRFCGTDTVSDFRPHYRYRNGSMGTLDRINQSGEFKNKAIPDGARSSIETDTRGNMITVNRQTIINDDMGALANLATTFGRMGGLSIEVDVFALLTANNGLGATFNGNPFFHNSNSNINTTGSALGVAGLDADRAVMRRQKDISGIEYLELRPAVLVIPVELYGEALVVNDAQYDNTANKLNVPNKVRGMFRDIVDSPRLTGTRRYLFADPSSGATAIKVVFLEGSGEAPVLESQEGWRVDGTEWKLRMDFEVQFFDPKGALTNAGA